MSASVETLRPLSPPTQCSAVQLVDKRIGSDQMTSDESTQEIRRSTDGEERRGEGRRGEE